MSVSDNGGAMQDVSRETVERLRIFSEVFRKWAKAVNLVAASTIDDLESRHIVDSLQIAKYAPEDATYWTDLGTGGGFPGLIVAAAQVESYPQRRFTLVESDQRKATFLREAARAMSLSVNVVTARIEHLAQQNADILSARALAPLEVLCEYAKTHLAPHGMAIFMKGGNYAKEVIMAKQAGWTFDLEYKASTTQAGSVIILMKNIVRDV
jgi:16S rRNA (guanine527-N7)-methyltransferase